MWGLGESGFARGSGSSAFNNTTAFDLKDNLTLTCAARNIQHPVELPFSTALDTTVRVFQFTFSFSLLIIGGVLNTLVIVLVAKSKKLRTLSFGIAFLISGVDLSLVIISNLVIMTNSAANRWLFEEHVCALNGILEFCNSILRSALLFIFVIDRFFTVFCPFAYPKYQRKVISFLLVFPWVFSAVFGIIGYVLDCYTFDQMNWLCSINVRCSAACSTFVGLFFLVCVIPMTVIFMPLSSLRRKGLRRR